MDPPSDGCFLIEGVQRIRGDLAVQAGPSVAWSGRGLALAEQVAEELQQLGWVRLRLVWFADGVRCEMCL